MYGGIRAVIWQDLNVSNRHAHNVPVIRDVWIAVGAQSRKSQAASLELVDPGFSEAHSSGCKSHV